MNKYVLIPYDQYERFKNFVAEEKEKEKAESNQETAESKSGNHKVDILEITEEKKAGNSDSENIGGVHNQKSKIPLDIKQNESINIQSSANSEDKNTLGHTLPPPGLPAEAEYSKDNKFSKIRKNGRKRQEGVGAKNWIQKWKKRF